MKFWIRNFELPRFGRMRRFIRIGLLVGGLSAVASAFFINATTLSIDPMEQYYLERYNSYHEPTCRQYPNVVINVNDLRSSFWCGKRTVAQMKSHLASCASFINRLPTDAAISAYSGSIFGNDYSCAVFPAMLPPMRHARWPSHPYFYDPKVMINNVLNGKYPAIPGRADCLWGEDVVKHASSVPAYSVARSPNCNLAGVKQTRTCDFGIMSGSFPFRACAPLPAPSPQPVLTTKNGCYVDELSCVRVTASGAVSQTQLTTSFGVGTLSTLLARSDVQGSEKLCAELADAFSEANKCETTVYGVFVKDSKTSISMSFNERPARPKSNTDAVIAIINSLLLDQ